MAESRSRRSTENESKIEVVQIDGLVSNLLNIDRMRVIKWHEYEFRKQGFDILIPRPRLSGLFIF